VGEARFVVEQAGCPTCAARIHDALAAIATVETIEIDERADVASVRLIDGDGVSEQTIAATLEAISVGGGHEYRVRPGSWFSGPT
jgi:hypothetical protein